ncbi:MAG: zeta toxin family protein [Proteobacteria bacterium]|nr:zeta toxin family protein [Pseudomonadota bacterium]
MTEREVAERALSFARANKKQIARRWADKAVYAAEAEPVSVFMAGSPGAGKTEASIELLETFKPGKILRIDPDELRSEFPEYAGRNSALFQPAVSVLVEKIHDLALEQQQSFILDGTLSNHERARRNVERSLGRQRTVQILYVYQSPMLAWQFVQSREASEGRHIQPEVFLEQYFAARQVVNRLKQNSAQVAVDMLMKNIDNSSRFYRAGVDQVDHHIPEIITRVELEHQLGLT